MSTALIARIARPLVPVLRQVRCLADQLPAVSIRIPQLIAGMSLSSMTAAAGLLLVSPSREPNQIRRVRYGGVGFIRQSAVGLRFRSGERVDPGG